MNPDPHIISIEGNSRQDGPGIRSVVFFKGCPLNCLWCHNPESKKTRPELWWDESKCIDCEDCNEICPQSALGKPGASFIARDRCDRCFECVTACPSAALKQTGSKMSPAEIVKKVLRYKRFFDSSGGGVTLTGGEPTLFMPFTAQLLRRFKAAGVHTLIETSGAFELEQFKTLLIRDTDMLFYDLKLMDPMEHRKYCGVDNSQIIENFIQLLSLSRLGDIDILPRTPLIPGITDSDLNIEALARFYQQLGVCKTSLLLNNPDWLQKNAKLGYNSPVQCHDPLQRLYDDEHLQRIVQQFAHYGVEAKPG